MYVVCSDRISTSSKKTLPKDKKLLNWEQNETFLSIVFPKWN